ncbi:circadian clock KaiB family protein [Herbiconiux sp.]|jgi:hypothetical protein|uniref:circadian clock KaiB family protein n=1 Tax=Herbiconiux sp. TaxID=1871186 RepID=UPI0025BBF553|nr:circadian clock KaiB family protein [Herbiconiux sp.]
MSGPDPRNPDAALTLLVAGDSPTSVAAQVNLARLIESRPALGDSLRVIDVLAEPHHAARHRVLFTPTLIVSTPEREFRVVGDLRDTAPLRFLLGDAPH